MAGINKVILVGNIGRVDVKNTQSGDKVVNLSLATSIKYNDKQTGKPVEQTEWHNCVFFKQVAEIAAKYLTKGMKIYVEGSLKTEKYEKDGIERYATKIIVRDMQMLGSKSDNEALAQGQQDQSYAKAKEGNLPLPEQQTDEPDWSDCPF